jgi:HK97 family phage portal protein
MGALGRDVGWHILFQRALLSRELQPLTTLQILQLSPAYAAVRLLAYDIAKLPLRGVSAVTRSIAGRLYTLWLPADTPADAVLRQPNHYQTLFDFIVSWVISLLLHSAAYVLKQRGPDGRVEALYVLDPGLVLERVADTGDIYYELRADELAGITDNMLVPAEFILAHRYLPLTSPLCGSSPLVPAGASATAKLATLIDGQAVPAGVITGPDSINQQQADEMSKRWLDKFGGTDDAARRGVAVLGSNFKFEQVSRSARDAQLIELAKFGAEDIARAFGIQPWLLGAGSAPVGEAMPAAMQLHYSQTLLPIMKPIQLLLTSALIPPRGSAAARVEFDPMGIMALDPMARSSFWESLLGAGVAAPNEARADFNLLPVPGGDSPFLQQQNYSLADLAKRSEKPDPFGSGSPEPPADPEQDPELDQQSITLSWRGTFRPCTTYDRGCLVHHHGTTWLATASTSAAPLPGAPGWSIFAARGRRAP